MEVKDTVMNIHQLKEAIKSRRELLEVQAEISWKAREPEIAEARKAGIKEVWDEIMSNFRVEDNSVIVRFGNFDTNGKIKWFDTWQAKLREWEIDKQVKEEKPFNPGAVDTL